MEIHGDVTRADETSETRRRLSKLSGSELGLLDPQQDIRGREVMDSKGNEIGTVDGLFVDEEAKKVRFVEVRSGGFLGLGASHFLLPVDAIGRVEPDKVWITHPAEKVKGAPRYDPQLAEAADWSEYYNYYGYPPYWGPAYGGPGVMI